MSPFNRGDQHILRLRHISLISSRSTSSMSVLKNITAKLRLRCAVHRKQPPTAELPTPYSVMVQIAAPPGKDCPLVKLKIHFIIEKQNFFGDSKNMVFPPILALPTQPCANDRLNRRYFHSRILMNFDGRRIF